MPSSIAIWINAACCLCVGSHVPYENTAIRSKEYKLHYYCRPGTYDEAVTVTVTERVKHLQHPPSAARSALHAFALHHRRLPPPSTRPFNTTLLPRHHKRTRFQDAQHCCCCCCWQSPSTTHHPQNPPSITRHPSFVIHDLSCNSRICRVAIVSFFRSGMAAVLAANIVIAAYAIVAIKEDGGEGGANRQIVAPLKTD